MAGFSPGFVNWLRSHPTQESWPANSRSLDFASRRWHETQSNLLCSSIVCENFEKVVSEMFTTGGSGVSAAVSVTSVFFCCCMQLAAKTTKAARMSAAFEVFLFRKNRIYGSL